MDKIIINGKSVSKMTLGTVQLGLNYGIANTHGQPDEKKSNDMLLSAIENGITSFDTARGYGTSEDVLGNFFGKNVNTEDIFLTSKFVIGLPKTATEKEVEKAIYSSVETSLEKLGVKKLDCLMHHRAHEVTEYGDIVQKTLKRLIDENYITMAGVSVYQPEELDEMFKHDVYRATQIPMNLFDQKLISRGYLDKMKDMGAYVFVRSVFLQGLFFLDPKNITDPDLIEFAKPYIEKIIELSNKENMSIAEFAISFIRDIPGVTSLVLGADTKEQIIENIRYMNVPALSQATREEVYKTFSGVNISKIQQVLSRPKE